MNTRRWMARLWAMALCCAMAFTGGLMPTGCRAAFPAACAETADLPALTRYNASFIGLFDTVTAIVGLSDSKEASRRKPSASMTSWRPIISCSISTTTIRA